MAAKKKTTKKTDKSTVKKSEDQAPIAKKAAKKAVKKSPAKKAATKVVAKKAAKTPSAPKTQKLKKPEKSIVLKGFAKKQHQRLLDLRDELLDAMYGVTHDTLKNTDGMETGAGGQHSGDAGSDSYDRDFALNLLAKEQDSLSEIEQAISRCARGVYGVCEMSGEKIPKERLEAIPFARYTVECQTRWEQENGNGKQPTGGDSFSFSSGAMR